MHTKKFKASQRICSGQQLYEYFMRTKGWGGGGGRQGYEKLVRKKYSGFTGIQFTALCCFFVCSIILGLPTTVGLERLLSTVLRTSQNCTITSATSNVAQDIKALVRIVSCCYIRPPIKLVIVKISSKSGLSNFRYITPVWEVVFFLFSLSLFLFLLASSF